MDIFKIDIGFRQDYFLVANENTSLWFFWGDSSTELHTFFFWYVWDKSLMFQVIVSGKFVVFFLKIHKFTKKTKVILKTGTSAIVSESLIYELFLGHFYSNAIF